MRKEVFNKKKEKFFKKINEMKSLLNYKLLISVIVSGILTNFFIIKLDKYLNIIVNKEGGFFKFNLVNLSLLIIAMISFILLLLFPYIIMFSKNDKKQQIRYYLLGLTLSLNVYLYLYLLNYKKIIFIIVIGIYLSVIYFVYVLLEVLEVVYSWLWETSYIKGNKVKKKYKKIDTKKLSLLWAIIIFILGILFNFKK